MVMRSPVRTPTMRRHNDPSGRRDDHNHRSDDRPAHRRACSPASTSAHPVYDREHRFFQEDFDELREPGYLNAAVPDRVRRRRALRFAEVQPLQRRLAYVAPATASAVNMHFYWTGIAADLSAAGDPSCDWMLAQAGRRRRCSPPATARRATTSRCCCRLERPSGSTAAGRSPATRSSARSRRYGPTSGSTPWTRATPTRPADRPRVPAARRAERYRIEQTWDVLGMRADREQRHDPRPARSCPTSTSPSCARPDSPAPACSRSAIFAWGLLGFAHRLLRASRKRAYDETVEPHAPTHLDRR